MRVGDVINSLESLAPQSLAEPWDNSGLLVGNKDNKVAKIYLCLDPILSNIKEAINCGANLIVSHHPLNIKSFKRITEDKVMNIALVELVKNDISLFSMHTNFDKADNGLNDILAQRLGMKNVRKCVDVDAKFINMMRIGEIESPVELAKLAVSTGKRLGCKYVRYVGLDKNKIKTLAVVSGSGGDCIYSAFNSGVDVLITGDITHHQAQLAHELGFNLVDCGHFESENIICEFLKEFFSDQLPQLSVIQSTAKPFFKFIPALGEANFK